VISQKNGIFRNAVLAGEDMELIEGGLTPESSLLARRIWKRILSILH